MKIGRNEPCPCRSGLKYKRCCGNSLKMRPPIIPYSKSYLERLKAGELIRMQQQGLGRPIISSKRNNQQIVVAGETKYSSPKWKTFPDFLSDYIKMILGQEWGNAEIAKPFPDRHTILKWYDEFCRYQRSHLKSSNEVVSSPMTGVVYCYLGLAYSLYQLKHNVELQNRLLNRLKNQAEFQGAYYELIVANSLIRTGFELELEDESDKSRKHCEFAAFSKKTGKRYWVEAKMRGVKGVLGKTEKDGTINLNPTSELIKHLNKALKKPAQNERLIFIDLNDDLHDCKRPEWVEMAGEKLDRYEEKLGSNERAYVFVTNIPFHRSLQSEQPRPSIMAHGLGIPDFWKPGNYRLSEIYRQKQKHIDAHDIMESFSKYPQLPATFDGGLASRLRENPYERIIIGQTYFFKGIGKRGRERIMTITSASVNVSEKTAYIGTSTGHIYKVPLCDDAIEDYKNHPEAFWGEIQKSSKNEVKSLYELFEILVNEYKKTSKNRLLEMMQEAPDFAYLQQLDQVDLVIEYCERCCTSLINKINLK